MSDGLFAGRLKPIPTEYRGVQMRSRLEAKVASALDDHDIEWHYEPQGYDLDGVWYLPDFWCPQIRTYVEVKGVLDADAIRKAHLLAMVANELPRQASDPWWCQSVGAKFDPRTGIHVVVLTSDDITTGLYAPSCADAWANEFVAAGLVSRHPGTVLSMVSAEYAPSEAEAWSAAKLHHCKACKRAFWRPRNGWWGCYACGAGSRPYGRGKDPCVEMYASDR